MDFSGENFPSRGVYSSLSHCFELDDSHHAIDSDRTKIGSETVLSVLPALRCYDLGFSSQHRKVLIISGEVVSVEWMINDRTPDSLIDRHKDECIDGRT